MPQRRQARAGVGADLQRRQAARCAAEQEAARQLLGAGLGDRVLDERQTRVLLTLLTRAPEARTMVVGRINGVQGQRRDGDTAGAVPGRLHGADRARVLRLAGLRLEVGPARGRTT